MKLDEVQIYMNQTDILIWLADVGGLIDDQDVEDRHILRSPDGVIAKISYSSVRSNAELRSLRIARARAIGTHTKSEWTALVDVFGCCVRCGVDRGDLIGGIPTKDHVLPIVAGGCDCIANIQPLCRHCNSGKPDRTDYRPFCRPDWVQRYIARLENGWE